MNHRDKSIRSCNARSRMYRDSQWWQTWLLRNTSSLPFCQEKWNQSAGGESFLASNLRETVDKFSMVCSFGGRDGHWRQRWTRILGTTGRAGQALAVAQWVQLRSSLCHQSLFGLRRQEWLATIFATHSVESLYDYTWPKCHQHWHPLECLIITFTRLSPEYRLMFYLTHNEEIASDAR